MEKHKILILGVDTLAGCNLAITWADRCEVIGISGRRNFHFDGCRIVTLESCEEQAISDVISVEQPQRIVVCGPCSYSSWDWQEDFDPADEVRRLATISRAAQHVRSRLTMISTDALNSGPWMFRGENFSVAENVATTSVVRRIENVLKNTNSLIVRTHLFGWSPAGESCVEYLWSALAEGRPIGASGECYATPILASDFAELLWQAQCQELSGLYHLSGAERTSMWHFASELAIACGASLPVLRKESNTPSVNGTSFQTMNHGQESSLDSRTLQRILSNPLPMVRDGIARFVQQSCSGYRDRVAATLAGMTLESAAA